MEYKDYYKILGVDRNADQASIKKAYRRLARKYHPDVSKEPEAEARFKEINEANEVLGDPEKRQAYDQLGSSWQSGQDFRPPPGWEHFSGFSHGGGGSGGFGGPGFGAAGGFSDFFESLFGGSMRQGTGRSRGGFRAHGQDQEAHIELDLEMAYQGGKQTLQLGNRKLNVNIPAGVTEGQRIRLSGQGQSGLGGGPAGNLYLVAHIRPHPLYRLDGRNVILSLPVAPWEAALGAQVTVPTLAGKVDLRIPARSSSGLKLRLKGRGLPGNPSGDQYVELRIETPPAETQADREFYERMQQELPFNPRAHLG